MSKEELFLLDFEWAPDQEQLVPTQAEPLDIHKAHHMLEEIKTQVQAPGLTLRFHASDLCRRTTRGMEMQ